ncbi:MAG: DUF7670 domain-containing protein [Halanaerobiales bacterium]
MKGRILIWLPRIISILFIIFISLFALDAFQGDASVMEKIVGFIIHLIPSFLLVVILIVSWKKYLLGGWLYIALAIVSIVFFHTYRHVMSFLVISLPLLTVGATYIWSGKRQNKVNL